MPTFSTSSIPDMTGKTVIVTGANSGIGRAAATALADHGARLVLAVRNTDKGDAAASQMSGTTEVRRLDLASLASVKEFAAAWNEPIDILINNAGIMIPPLSRTADGFELQFGINHLGHFLLTTLLLPELRAAAATTGNARVVTVSSEAHRHWGIDLDDIDFEQRGYDTFLAYGQAKSANILMTVELQRRVGSDGITALAVHPGTCATNLGRYLDRATAKKLFAMSAETFAPENMKSVAQAAATTVWAATAPSLAGSGGAYLADCQIAQAAPAATDSATARRLWLLSQEWVKR